MTAPRSTPLFDNALPALASSAMFRLLDRRKKKRLLPFRWTTPPYPRMSGSNRTSEDAGKSSGTQSKAIVPIHDRNIPAEKINAMRNYPLAFPYALRKTLAQTLTNPINPIQPTP